MFFRHQEERLQTHRSGTESASWLCHGATILCQRPIFSTHHTRVRTALATWLAAAIGPRISLWINMTASSSCQRARWTWGNEEGTGNWAGPSASRDISGSPFWLMQSLMTFEDSTRRAVRPWRVRSEAGSILSSRLQSFSAFR